ncbi:chain length determinant protein [Pontibacter sp. FD36]|uniref:chain length determinant protein n=1 Tax=Pontibacter sp. FD36 TaxID=2789860 RepID=UPI0018ABD2E8|nr:chain length determinant protein [Pontibacter sp. FD36]MBF8964578.1 chain length determinant protein [Pontibacter sp. FD36]
MYNLDDKDKAKREYTQDEIDLNIVFKKLGEFGINIERGISNLIQLIIRRAAFLFIFTSLSIGIGYGLYSLIKPFYTSSMTLVLANIRNEFIEDQLNKLSEMIEDDNFEAVAERLDITAATAKEIKEMNFYNLDQNRIDEDSVLTGSPFRIELTIYDPQLFDNLEPAIMNYLENNRYFARQKRIKQKQVENMIAKLRGEISSIDSMKTNVSEPRGPVNGFVYGQPIDPTNLYRESISMYKEQVNLEADLEKLANVEIVTGFTPRLRPTGPSLKKYLAISGLVGLLFGIMVAVILENKKRRRAALA